MEGQIDESSSCCWSLLAIGLLLSVLSGSASAAAPRITPINDSFDFTSTLCGFPVQVAERAQGFEIQYFDAAGNPTRDVLQQTLTGTWTNPRSGQYLVERSRLRAVIQQDGGFYEFGLNFHIRLPSGRTVLIDAGKHQVQDGDVSAFCAELS